jgi:hypothetical protein
MKGYILILVASTVSATLYLLTCRKSCGDTRCYQALFPEFARTIVIWKDYSSMADIQQCFAELLPIFSPYLR